MDGNRAVDTKAPRTGMRLTAYGATSGKTSGKVTDTSVDGYWSNIYFDELFLTDIPTSPGDSGAPYIYNSSANGSIVGILKGGKGGYDNSVGTDITTSESFGIVASH